MAGFDPQRLRAARTRAGLNFRELSERTGIPGPTLHRYEKGRSKPRADKIRAMAEGLGCDTSYLAPPPTHPTLSQLRESAGLTLRNIATEVGFTPVTVARIERGVQWPDDAEGWARAYGLTLKQFAEAWRRS